MKKLKHSLLVFLMVMFLVPGVLGVLPTTTTSLSSTGSALAELSTEHPNSSSHSARLLANKIVSYPPTNEGRIRIVFDTPMLLNDLENISWNQYVESGYMAHLDLFIDINGSGNYNEVLIFEGEKSTVNGSGFCDSGVYPTGDALVTFGANRGEVINDIIYAWLNGDVPGPCGNETFENIHKPLSEWKTNYSGATIIAFEIEVDGWIQSIVTSEAFIDDITLNGVVIEDFEDTQNIEVNISEDIRLSISPLTLDFGTLLPGTNDNPGPDIVLDATGSNVDVNVEVTSVTGFPFETGLKIEGQNPIWPSTILTCNATGNVCTWGNSPTNWITSLSIPIGASSNKYLGVITYLVMGPTP